MKRVVGVLSTVAILSVMVFYWLWSQSDVHRFRVTFLAVGQGDSALIQFRDGHHMLVDCGPDAGVLAHLGRALPWYERTIDYLVVTHPDRDHYAGCIDVLKRYRVGHIITNGRSKSDALYQEFSTMVQAESGAWIGTQETQENIELAQTRLEFLAPDPHVFVPVTEEDSNNASIVFRLVDEPSALSILFTGDMEERLEQALLARYCPEKTAQRVPCPAITAHVLKVGHHGSETSSGNDFLAAVAPEIAIVSAGKFNQFHHPSPRVIKRLERIGIRILRTAEQGDIVLP